MWIKWGVADCPEMRFHLRTLLITAIIGPPILAGALKVWDAIVMPLIWRFITWPPL